MDTTPEPSTEKLVIRTDNHLSAPEVFASRLAHVAVEGPNMRLTFTSMRVSQDDRPKQQFLDVVCLRVVMSRAGVADAVAFLSATLESGENKPPSPPENKDPASS